MKTLMSIFFMFFSLLAQSQYYDTIPHQNTEINKNLRLDITGMTFFHNEEYLNPFTEGTTLIGYQVRPRIAYHLNENTEVSAGIHLLQNAGRNSFSQVIPLFRIRHRFNDHFTIIMGNIYGASHHRLDEIIYNYERSFNDNVEYGLQFLYDNDRWDLDLWLDWEQFIEKNDPFQEIFTQGFRGSYNLIEQDKFSFQIGTQWLIRHQGGQIDNSPERVSTIADIGTGITIGFKLENNRELRLRAYYYNYSAIDNPDNSIHSQFYDTGNAIQADVSYHTTRWRSHLGYFKGHQFIASLGEYLYQSVSDYNDNYSGDRDLLYTKVFYKIPYNEDFCINLMTGIYYDIGEGTADYSYGINMKIKSSFFLKQWKN